MRSPKPSQPLKPRIAGEPYLSNKLLTYVIGEQPTPEPKSSIHDASAAARPRKMAASRNHTTDSVFNSLE
jgi:hypothetical protein